MGACMLVRRAAIDAVGPPDASFFLFSEEVDWLLPLRRRRAGRRCFTPDAECMHVGGASHGGRLYRDNLRGHMRFFLKHHGLAAGGERPLAAPHAQPPPRQDRPRREGGDVPRCRRAGSGRATCAR